MSVRLFNIVLSSLFFLTQTYEMRASDPVKEESPKQMKKRLLPPSPTITIGPETTSKEGKKEKIKKSQNRSPEAVEVTSKERKSAAAATPKIENPQNILKALLGETQAKKKENFSPPKTLDVHEIFLVLLAGYHGIDPLNPIYNKVSLVKYGKACNFVSMHEKSMIELRDFLHFGQILKNEGFMYLRKIYLINDEKAAVISTEAEEITKNLRSTEEITQKLREAQSGQKKYTQDEFDKLKNERQEIEAVQRAFEKIERSKENFDSLLLDLNPGTTKNRSLSELKAIYEYDEKRPFATLAKHDSVYAWYRLYVRDEQTDFVIGVQLYQMSLK